MRHTPSAFLILLPAIFFACGRPDSFVQPVQDSAKRPVEQTDALGRKILLPPRPQRIISLAPSVTEVLFMLGAGDRVIGVTSHCNWPEEARRKPRISDLLSPNYERVLAAKPDLVIASTAGNDRSAVQRLAELGLPVFVTAPRSIEAIWQTIEQVGSITGRQQAAASLIAEGKARIAAVERGISGLPRTTAIFITWFDPLLAPGRSTFETSVLRCAGVDSISADIDEFYPRYSLEQILAHQPDVVLTVEHTGQPLPDLARLPGWRDLDAVRGKRVYVLPEVFQHPSPRFVEGVETLARLLHPERFP